MVELKEFAVELVVTTVHNYTVLARSAEEAVDAAEDLLDSGDEGEVVETSIDTADAASGEVAFVNGEELGEDILFSES